MYRIAYGSVTPAASTMAKPVVRQFNPLGAYSRDKWQYSMVVIASNADTILGIFTDLASGKSLKTSFVKWGFDVSSIDFDVTYTSNTESEPWRSENYTDSQLIYSKVIWMLNPESLFEIDGNIPDDVDHAMQDLAKLLDKQTRLHFSTHYNHIGNLELLYTPDRDVNGKPLVECKLDKEKFKLLLTVDSQLTDECDCVIANARLSRDGVIVCDNICSADSIKGQSVTFSFGRKEQIDRSEVKIWLKQRGKTMLVYDVTMHYIQRIMVQMSIVSDRMMVKTDWLEKLRLNLGDKKKAEVNKAELIEHKGSENFRVGGISERRKRKQIVKPRIKSNDVFFPKGWDKETDEVGLLGFLEWFKNKTEKAKSVFLQDPYFEDVALFFIASANAGCEYTILTQTSLKTNADGTDSMVEEGERKDKIINVIKGNPRLFAPLKLIVKDMPGNKAKLHDRYMFFWYDGYIEAYTLSNSLQGATQKQPLLITQIGDDALELVNKHIDELINQSTVDTIFDYVSVSKDILPRCEEIADQGFYNWLITMDSLNETDFVKSVLPDIIRWNTIPKLSTLGYYLATQIPDRCDNLRKELLKQMNGSGRWIQRLKDYILVHHYDTYPCGYRNNKRRLFCHYDMAPLLSLNFDEIVSRGDVSLLDYIQYETLTCGVYGQYYAAWLLVRLSSKEFIDILRLYMPTYDGITTDKSIEPISRSANVLFQILVKYALYVDNTIIKELLSDKDKWCRGVGSLILLYLSRKDDFNPADYKSYLSSDSEVITLCKAAWMMVPKPADKQFFYDWMVESYKSIGNEDIVIQNLVSLMLETTFLERKKELVENVIMPLIQPGLVDKNKACSELINALFDDTIDDESRRREGHSNYYSIQRVLPATLRIINGDLRPLVDKSQEAFRKAKAGLDALIIKTEDNIFSACKPLMYLRNLLISVSEEYQGVQSNPEIDELSRLCAGVDRLLDDVGYKDIKRKFEYNC